LKEVEVHFTHDDDDNGDHSAFLSALAENAPMLQNLTLDGYFYTGSLGILASYRMLRILDILGLTPPIDQHSFNILSLLPQLCKLAIDLEDTRLDFSSRSGSFPFAALETLEVAGCLTSFASLLAFISSSCLRTLTFMTYHIVVPDAWRTLIHTSVSTAHYAHTLRSILVWLECQKSQISIMQVMEPLLDLRDLEEICLRLDGFACQGLMDDDFALLTSAWPNMTSLGIVTSPNPDPMPTFISLHTLAVHSPQLTSLALTLDLTNLPLVDDIPIFSHRLEELHIGHSNVGDPTHFIHLLDHIYPHLGAISTEGSAAEEGELNKLRQLYQDARKDARVQ
jgi:hypothetical protein